jgi:hypothetical protein
MDPHREKRTKNRKVVVGSSKQGCSGKAHVAHGPPPPYPRHHPSHSSEEEEERELFKIHSPIEHTNCILRIIRRIPSKRPSIGCVVLPCMSVICRVLICAFGRIFMRVGTPPSIAMQRNTWWKPSGLTGIGWPLGVTPSSTKSRLHVMSMR